MFNDRRDNVAYHGDNLRYGRAMGLVSEARSEDEEHAGEVIRTISRMRESLHNLPEQELYRLPRRNRCVRYRLSADSAAHDNHKGNAAGSEARGDGYKIER